MAESLNCNGSAFFASSA